MILPSKTIPTIAIVGRQNVGKSTLYNRITRSRDALVADIPGLTRDPKIGIGSVGGKEYLVADTGGLSSSAEKNTLQERVSESTEEIAKASEAILFVVDSKEGLIERDKDILSSIRKWNKPTLLVANKSENVSYEFVSSEFSPLGLNDIYAVSAKQNQGVNELISSVTNEIMETKEKSWQAAEGRSGIFISIIGRPNVGKSTLINQIVGYDRLITSDIPGTTRDDIRVDFERNGKNYSFIDTAGLRRKSRVTEYSEKLTSLRTLKAITSSQITILVIDADESIIAQDLTLLGHVLTNGKALVIAANKWDRLTKERKNRFLDEIERRFSFVKFSEVVFISAKYGFGIDNLFDAVQKTWKAISFEIKTGHLSKILEKAVENHPPPLVKGRRIKLRFAHVGNRNPLTILIYGNQLKSMPLSYTRYLENFFRSELKLSGTPIKIIYRQTDNPYAGKKNKLSRRQISKRKRLLRYSKKNR